MKDDFYQVELNKTTWDIPKRYGNLSPVGSGAYGQVRTIYSINPNKKINIFIVKLLMILYCHIFHYAGL